MPSYDICNQKTSCQKMTSIHNDTDIADVTVIIMDMGVNTKREVVFQQIMLIHF